jgi:hypothetical protein
MMQTERKEIVAAGKKAVAPLLGAPQLWRHDLWRHSHYSGAMDHGASDVSVP